MHEGERPSRDVEALTRLEALGVLAREGDAYHPTRRFRGAMMRACLHLMAAGDPGEDLRVPLAFALVDVLGGDEPDSELARFVEAMLPIQLGELAGDAGRHPDRAAEAARPGAPRLRRSSRRL